MMTQQSELKKWTEQWVSNIFVETKLTPDSYWKWNYEGSVFSRSLQKTILESIKEVVL